MRNSIRNKRVSFIKRRTSKSNYLRSYEVTLYLKKVSKIKIMKLGVSTSIYWISKWRKHVIPRAVSTNKDYNNWVVVIWQFLFSWYLARLWKDRAGIPWSPLKKGCLLFGLLKNSEVLSERCMKVSTKGLSGDYLTFSN